MVLKWADIKNYSHLYFTRLREKKTNELHGNAVTNLTIVLKNITTKIGNG